MECSTNIRGDIQERLLSICFREWCMISKNFRHFQPRFSNQSKSSLITFRISFATRMWFSSTIWCLGLQMLHAVRKMGRRLSFTPFKERGRVFPSLTFLLVRIDGVCENFKRMSFKSSGPASNPLKCTPRSAFPSKPVPLKCGRPKRTPLKKNSLKRLRLWQWDKFPRSFCLHAYPKSKSYNSGKRFECHFQRIQRTISAMSVRHQCKVDFQQNELQ